MSSTPVTKADLAALADGLRATLRENTRDVLQHQQESLAPIRQDVSLVRTDLREIRHELGEVNTKLGAIMTGEVLVTRHQLTRLLQQLNARGVRIDEQDIFAS
jgi:exonuclease VII large subunit